MHLPVFLFFVVNWVQFRLKLSLRLLPLHSEIFKNCLSWWFWIKRMMLPDSCSVTSVLQSSSSLFNIGHLFSRQSWVIKFNWSLIETKLCDKIKTSLWRMLTAALQHSSCIWDQKSYQRYVESDSPVQLNVGRLGHFIVGLIYMCRIPGCKRFLIQFYYLPLVLSTLLSSLTLKVMSSWSEMLQSGAGSSAGLEKLWWKDDANVGWDDGVGSWSSVRECFLQG